MRTSASTAAIARSGRRTRAARPTPTSTGYALANFRVGFREEDRWDVYAWVRNAFDKDYFDFLSVPSGNTGLISGQPGDPRTWGATIQVHF